MKFPSQLSSAEHKVYAFGLGLPDQGNRKISCPFDGCSQRTNRNDPSLSVKRDGECVLYKCHYCHVKDMIGPEKTARVIVQPPMAPASPRPPAGDPLADFMKARAIDADKFKDYLGLESHWFTKAGDNHPSVVFLYKRGGKITYRKWRSLVEKDFASQGKAEDLYLLNIANGDDLIITEGELDALALRTAGFNAVSIPAGASSLDWLDFNQPTLKEYRTVTFWGDNDGQGREYLLKLKAKPASLLTNFLFVDPDVFTADFPGCKDANDVLVKGLDPKLALSKAKKLPLKWLVDIDELDAALRRIKDGAYAQRVAIGEKELDRLYSPVGGYITLVTGIPGHGKSTWLNWYTSRLAATFDWRIGFWSPENDPALQYADLINIYARRPMSATAAADPLDEDKIAEAKAWVGDHFKIISDYEGDGTIETILDQALTLKLQYGIRGLVIDPWNFISLPPGNDNGDRIRVVLARIGAFAKRFNIHIWVVAHPTKMQEQWKSAEKFKADKESGVETENKLKIPKGYDISGSAHFYNMTDCGVTVYREDDNATRFVVWKSRRKFLGQEGKCVMFFDADQLSFTCEDPLGRYAASADPYTTLDDF